MALIKCPECKKKISDQCGNCPQCGYPINISVENENTVTEASEKLNLVSDGKRPFYKTIWFWIVVSVVAIAAIVTIVLVFTRDTKPKYDKEGNPVFVELTNEVYTNAKDYLGYHINIKGKVFQVMGDNGTSKGIQIWLDPDTCEQNLMIYYTSDVEVKQDDYIMCSGYIDSVTKYKNAYDAELHVPLVYSTDLKKVTYIDVMAPATETIIPEALKYEKFGYSISIDKIEFSEKETRVYATATNNGKALMNVGDAVIVQEGKQYKEESNYDAEYDEISYEVVKGASSSGIIVFPVISFEDFEVTIALHSDDYDEEFDEFVFLIGKESASVRVTEKPIEEPVAPAEPEKTVEVIPQKTFPSAVGTYIYVSQSGWNHILHIYANGTLFMDYELRDPNSPNSDSKDCPLEGTWTQNDATLCYSVWNTDGFVWNNPFYDTVYDDGIDFLGDFYTRQ